MGKKELDLIIEAIADAKEVTRRGHHVKVYIRRDNQLAAIYPEEMYDILLKLQDDEKIIKVKTFPHRHSYISEVFLSQWQDGKLGFSVKILEPFDKYYTDYRAKTKNSTEKLLQTRGAKVIHAPKPEVIYHITFTKAREILLNDSYQIARPDFDRENEQVFSYLYNHPNKKFTTKQLEEELQANLAKTFHKIVENLGFRGALKNAFFNVGNVSIEFKNPIKSGDLAPSVVTELNSLIAKD